MNVDFSLILVILVFVSGVIWGLDSLIWAKKRVKTSDEQSEDTKGESEPKLVEFARFLFPVVLIVLLLRGFVVEPFKIPSDSMLPTLEDGDYILVSKFSYGLRLPVTHHKILGLGDPQRGDVVVFRYPRDPSVNYIKRVIGVPGDEVAYYNKVLYINGKPVKLAPGGQYQQGFYQYRRLHEESVELQHDILVRDSEPAVDFIQKVPPGHYFVMGDNRDNSNDSRFWGFVPDDHLVGRAFFIWMNWGDGGPQLKRIGTSIQ